MADHVITLRYAWSGLWLLCSCGLQHDVAVGEAAVELDELNRLAHEHIETAEAVEINARDMRLNGHLHAGLPEGDDPAYGAESAVTSENDLVPLYGDDDPGDGYAL